MKILYIEPFYDGSHKQWIDSYKKYSSHEIDILSMPGKKWKWRMHGGAITLANQFNKSNKIYDLILCSDFLNLPVFKSLCQNKMKKIPTVMYYHENQASYPWSPNDEDVKLNRDFHYYFINQTSSLASDWNLFNSNYHLESYLLGLKKYLNKMPDNKNIDTIKIIKNKSSVLYLGCELEKFSRIKKNKKQNNDKPIILWNHRWEFDKNPDLFFKILIKLKEDGFKYSLIILGESFENSPNIFNDAKKVLKEEIIHFGFCESAIEYKKYLWKADIIPVTSIQDFFGISIMEAVYCDTFPILPNRLAYKELFNQNKNPDLFYNTDTQLYNKLKNAIQGYKHLPSYSNITRNYDWSEMGEIYDKKLSDLTLKVSY
tara:strand:- start:37 stop:1152 length:1116 start_codon:yes stop_codon:yes gene_type:complete